MSTVLLREVCSFLQSQRLLDKVPEVKTWYEQDQVKTSKQEEKKAEQTREKLAESQAKAQARLNEIQNRLAGLSKKN